jgi:hypothetical protein
MSGAAIAQGMQELLDAVGRRWNNNSIMSQSKPETRITQPLQEAIVQSGIPLLALERETGVKRASIRKFLRGETSLYVDAADRLAAHLGLRLTVDSKRRK